MSRAFPLAVLAALWFSGAAPSQGTPGVDVRSKKGADMMNRAFNAARTDLTSGMVPAAFKVGNVGELAQNGFFYYQVDRILGDKEMIVVPASVGEFVIRKLWDQSFIVRNVPTKGLADGQRVPLDGIFKVVSTDKKLGRTMFVVEAEPEAERLKREAAVKAAAEERERRVRAEEAARAAEENERALLKAEREKAEAPAKREKAAASGLNLIRQLIDAGKLQGAVAKIRLQQFIKQYDGTKAAEEAGELFKKL